MKEVNIGGVAVAISDSWWAALDKGAKMVKEAYGGYDLIEELKKAEPAGSGTACFVIYIKISKSGIVVRIGLADKGERKRRSYRKETEEGRMEEHDTYVISVSKLNCYGTKAKEYVEQEILIRAFRPRHNEAEYNNVVKHSLFRPPILTVEMACHDLRLRYADYLISLGLFGHPRKLTSKKNIKLEKLEAVYRYPYTEKFAIDLSTRTGFKKYGIFMGVYLDKGKKNELKLKIVMDRDTLLEKLKNKDNKNIELEECIKYGVTFYILRKNKLTSHDHAVCVTIDDIYPLTDKYLNDEL